MARQCTQPKRPMNEAWYKEKAMLAKAQEAGQILDEEQLAFLADLGVPDGQAVQTIIPNNAAFHTEDLDTYDSDCDDISNAQAVLMANISNYGSDVISEIPHSETYLNDMENQDVQEMKEHNNELVTAELERYKERVKTFEQRLNIDLSGREKMIDSQMDDMIKEKLALKEQVDSLEQNISKQTKEKECLLQTFNVFKSESKEKEDKYTENQINLEKKIKELDNILFKSRSKMSEKAKDPEIININISHKPIDYEKLNRLSKDFGKRFTPQQEMDAEQAFWFRISNPTIESSNLPHVKVEVPSELPKASLVNSSLKNLKFHLAQFESVVKKRTTHDACTKDESCDNQNALEIPEFFKNNDLKAQPQDKDSDICKLKDIIKSMREKSKEENGNYDYCEIETKNVELENSVAKLLSENERLCNEINHVKQVLKEKNEDLKAQIQDKVFVITSLKNDLRKIKGKEIVDNTAQIPSANTIVPEMFKLDLEPLAPRLLQNREAHIDYLKYTQEQADILQGIELLVYVRDTCPNAINLSAKKVAVTPKNKVKKVRFAEPLTSSSNIKQVESSKTSDSNTPVLSSTGLKCSTSKCGSKPTGNKKKPSRNMKNKVEAQPRKVNKKNSVVEPIRDVDVKHSLLNANSEPICATCKKSMFDGVHDMCLLDFVENVNSRAKSAKKHKKQNIWKPTGHVFTEVGLKWKPTGRTFTIVGNSCPLTRITSAKVVPPKKTTSHSIVLWYLDSGCSKHITGNRSQLMNFVSKFLGRIRFGNDNIARIMRYGDYHLGNVIITRVYYVEGLGHNLFSVGQFCDGDLEVAFQKNTCFIHNLKGVDLLSGSRDTNLYTISLHDMLKTSLICLLSKASKTKSWLWHRRLSHLNFCIINKLAKDGLARGIPRLKFQKDHLTKDEAPEDKKPDLSFFHVFGALCYSTNDNDDLGKLDAKADIGIFVCYMPAKKAFRIYNKRTQKIIETIHVTFDELTSMASEQFSLGPRLLSMTPTTSCSGLVLNLIL
ncbi:retrovirus-related pol polyprotein from transposon TNT 1-94 [Tanacetum coccineum]